MRNLKDHPITLAEKLHALESAIELNRSAGKAWRHPTSRTPIHQPGFERRKVIRVHELRSPHPLFIY
jgi:hypothetical protein